MHLEFLSHPGWYVLAAGALLASAIAGFGSATLGRARHSIHAFGCGTGLIVLVLVLWLHGWEAAVPLLVIGAVGSRLGTHLFLSTWGRSTGRRAVMPRDIQAAHFHRWLRETLPSLKSIPSLSQMMENPMDDRRAALWERERVATAEFLTACYSDSETGPLFETAGCQPPDLERFMRVFGWNGGPVAGAMTLCTPSFLAPFLDELRSAENIRQAAMNAIARVGLTDVLLWGPR